MTITPKFDTKATAQRTYERVLHYLRTKHNGVYGFDVKQEVVGTPSPKSKKAPLVDALMAAEQAAWAASCETPGGDEPRIAAYKAAFEEEAQKLAEQFGLTYKPVGTTLRA